MAAVREIAAKAGVSPAAVSRVLNMDRSFSVSDETRKRIPAAADELQYRPARQGRGMTKVVMLILHSESEELEDPYYLNVRLHIRRAAEEERMELSEIFLPESPELPHEASECAGLLVLGDTSRWTPELQKAVEALKIPAGLVDFPAESRILDCASDRLGRGAFAPRRRGPYGETEKTEEVINEARRGSLAHGALRLCESAVAKRGGL